jgi:serine/threonine-protein kinase
LIGKTISELFAVERKQTKSLVEAQLSKVASLSAEEYDAVEASAKAGFLVSGTTAHGEMSSRTGRGPAAEKRSVGRMAAILLGAASLVGIGVMSTMVGKDAKTAQARPEVAPAAAAAAVPTAAEKATPARVNIRISASPPEAKLFFDGEPLAMNPFIRELPPDTSEHEVRAEAEGYRVGTAKFVGDRDAEIILKLERVTTEKRKTIASQPAPRKPAGPAAKPGCDPPFTIDSQGIKKFKVECL